MMDDPEKKRSSRIKSRKWEPSELEAILNYIKDSAERDLCVEKPTSSAFLEKLLKDLNWKNIEYSQLKNKMFKLRKSYIDALLWRDQNGPVVEDDSLLYNQLLEMCPHFDLFSKIYDGRINYKKYAPKQSPTHSISNDTTSQNFISDHQQTIPTRMLMDCAVISIDSLGKIVHRCLICNQTIESLPIAHIRSHFKDLFECHICQQSCDSLEFLVEHVNLFHSHEVPNSEDGDPLDIADLEIENVDFEPRLDTQSDHDNYCENIMSLSDKNNDDATLKDNIYHQTRDISNEGNAFDSPDGTNLVIDHEESIQSLGNDEDSLKPTKTTNLLNFEAVRNDSGQREYPCQICRAKFKTKHRLKEHFLTVHLRYKKFQCEICGKQFGGKNNLLRHTLVHKDQSQKEMQECSVCEKKFSEKGNLIQHMRSHTGEKPYKCAVCDKSFSHSSYVRTHMKIHTGERPYKCTLCDSEFRTTGELNYHMQKHKNDKPFKCDYCDKRFYLNRDLKDHTNTHTGDRPYQCKDCSRKFAKWSTLRQHEKLHKDKSYSCDQCGRRFAQDAGWRNHVTRGRCSTRSTLSSDSKNCSQRPSIHTVDALDGSNVDVPNDSEAGSLSGDLQTDDYENEL